MTMIGSFSSSFFNGIGCVAPHIVPDVVVLCVRWQGFQSVVIQMMNVQSIGKSRIACPMLLCSGLSVNPITTDSLISAKILPNPLALGMQK